MLIIKKILVHTHAKAASPDDLLVFFSNLQGGLPQLEHIRQRQRAMLSKIFHTTLTQGGPDVELR